MSPEVSPGTLIRYLAPVAPSEPGLASSSIAVSAVKPGKLIAQLQRNWQGRLFLEYVQPSPFQGMQKLRENPKHEKLTQARGGTPTMLIQTRQGPMFTQACGATTFPVAKASTVATIR
jgi:hypothetical protein